MRLASLGVECFYLRIERGALRLLALGTSPTVIDDRRGRRGARGRLQQLVANLHLLRERHAVENAHDALNKDVVLVAVIAGPEGPAAVAFPIVLSVTPSVN